MATLGNITISNGMTFVISGATVPVFDPDGGTSAGSPVNISNLFGTSLDPAQVTITCTQSATWTWILSGDTEAIASVASGGIDTTIIFTLNNLGSTTLSSSFTLTAVSGSVTRYYTIDLQNTGTQ